MTILPQGDTVSYDRGGINSTAEMVAAMLRKSDGSAMDIVPTKLDGTVLPTYTSTMPGYTAYATPTDMVMLRNTSASKIMHVLTLRMLINSTTATLITMSWRRRSADNNGGTYSTGTVVSQDSNNPAPAGQIRAYTSAPSALGAETNGGLLAQLSFGTTAFAAIGANFSIPNIPQTMATSIAQSITLRPGEALVMNLNGAALPSGFSALVEAVWTESDT